MKYTEEEKRQLIEKIKSTYKVGDVVDQTVAYGGFGSQHKIKHDGITIDNSSGNISMGNVGIYHIDHKVWATILKRNEKLYQEIEYEIY